MAVIKKAATQVSKSGAVISKKGIYIEFATAISHHVLLNIIINEPQSIEDETYVLQIITRYPKLGDQNNRLLGTRPTR
jgi:hypothetical protein